MTYSIRPGTFRDMPGIEKLLPRLADFEVPAYRVPEHLWQGDRGILLEWANGNRDDMKVAVATAGDKIVGVAALTMKKEMLSGEPSAHLEVLSVAGSAEGAGIGSALMNEIETIASNNGAQSISLHVFSNNKRARALYERQGFNDELLRYFKPIGDAGSWPGCGE